MCVPASCNRKEANALNVSLYTESRRCVACHPPTSGDNNLIPRGARMSLDEVCLERRPGVFVFRKGLPRGEGRAVRVADLMERILPTSAWSPHSVLTKS